MTLIFAGAWPNKVWPQDKKATPRLDRRNTTLVVRDAAFRSSANNELLYVPDQAAGHYRTLEMLAPPPKGGEPKWQAIMRPSPDDPASGMTLCLDGTDSYVSIRPAAYGRNMRVRSSAILDLRWLDSGTRPALTADALASKTHDYVEGLAAQQAANEWHDDTSRLQWPEDETQWQLL